MVTPMAYYDLIDRFALTGCAVCRLLKRDAQRHLDGVVYEYTLDRELHRIIRAARGLCNEHGWQLLEVAGAAVGISVVYRAVVDEVIEQTEAQGGSNANPQKLAQKLEATEQCVTCKLLNKAEQAYITTFTQYLTDVRFKDAYQQSAGLCLPHVRMALRQKLDKAQVRLLLDSQQQMWVRLRADLELFQDKNQHDRHGEELGAEADSWRRAVAQMAGERGVFGLSRRGEK
ncbi:MAG: hypothetical protein KF726_20825 [Anaerolineae bacterium]|nr:hypothetical protein [Anaerolineae bacterium]